MLLSKIIAWNKSLVLAHSKLCQKSLCSSRKIVTRYPVNLKNTSTFYSTHKRGKEDFHDEVIDKYESEVIDKDNEETTEENEDFDIIDSLLEKKSQSKLEELRILKNTSEKKKWT